MNTSLSFVGVLYTLVLYVLVFLTSAIFLGKYIIMVYPPPTRTEAIGFMGDDDVPPYCSIEAQEKRYLRNLSRWTVPKAHCIGATIALTLAGVSHIIPPQLAVLVVVVNLSIFFIFKDSYY